ncbi:MAG: zinc finger domain-containing protein [Pseudonocardiaceae bacterium]
MTAPRRYHSLVFDLVQSRPCPKCRAPAGEPCISAYGLPHLGRRGLQQTGTERRDQPKRLNFGQQRNLALTVRCTYCGATTGQRCINTPSRRPLIHKPAHDVRLLHAGIIAGQQWRPQ